MQNDCNRDSLPPLLGPTIHKSLGLNVLCKSIGFMPKNLLSPFMSTNPRPIFTEVLSHVLGLNFQYKNIKCKPKI